MKSTHFSRENSLTLPSYVPKANRDSLEGCHAKAYTLPTIFCQTLVIVMYWRCGLLKSHTLIHPSAKPIASLRILTLKSTTYNRKNKTNLLGSRGEEEKEIMFPPMVGYDIFTFLSAPSSVLIKYLSCPVVQTDNTSFSSMKSSKEGRTFTAAAIQNKLLS